MKKIIALLLIFTTIGVFLSACGSPSGRIEYELNNDGKSYRVSFYVKSTSVMKTTTGKNGQIIYSRNKASEKVVIPEKYNGLPVTAIGEDAFSDGVNVVSITIPKSVTSICKNAFNSCTYLQKIIYKGTMAQWDEIKKEYGWQPFLALGGLTIKCTDGEI